ncbi:HAMP domain-containing sensor histidine kinase [Sorangium sp. So ce136]|uniref:sensor histidine kinase n=1 Tax=Sorangium sp. So ce136 TaxID=3133284 RepID=UPI003EFDAAA5
MHAKRRRDWYDWMPLAALLPIGLVLFLSLLGIQGVHRRNVAAAVQAVLSTTHKGLLTWARQKKSTAWFWANQPSVRRAIAAQIEQRRDGGSLHDSPYLQELRNTLDSVVQQNGCRGFDVIAIDGTHIASDRDELIATKTLSARDPDTIAAAARGSVVFGAPFPMRSPVVGEVAALLLVAAPVHALAEGGEIIATLVFRIDPGMEFTEIAQRGAVGAGGETYAFDARGRVVTELRFSQSLRDMGILAAGERSILNVEVRDPGVALSYGLQRPLPRSEQPLTRMATSAVAGNAGVDVDGYRDYRGMAVVGAWLWDRELDLGLATEIDKAEAYIVYHTTRRVVIAACAATLLVTLLMTFLLQGRAKDLATGVVREQELRGQLEDRVHRLECAEAELKDAVRVREEFLRFASHELRTPLTSLRLLYEHLLRSRTKSSMVTMGPKDIGRFLKVSSRELARITQVINNMFVVASFSTGPPALNLGRAELNEIVRRTVRQVTEQLEADGCSLELGLGRPVFGYWDEARIEQVITNLLSNASRHGAGQPIKLSVSSQGGFAVISVQDRGVGIALEQRERLFEPFRWTPDAHGGLGVGLYVCRLIVWAHGGEILVEGEPGDGTTFRVRLPLPPEIDAGDAAPALETESWSVNGERERGQAE